jgi:hypothetical protein
MNEGGLEAPGINPGTCSMQSERYTTRGRPLSRVAVVHKCGLEEVKEKHTRSVKKGGNVMEGEGR